MTHNNVLMKILFPAIILASTVSPTMVHAADETVLLSGSFGSFIDLGATLEEVQSMNPDRVDPQAADGNRVASSWHYFTNRGIRVRVCDDNQRVEAINAAVTPATRKYVTEAGVRIGANLQHVAEAYGNALELMPETEGTIWFVEDQDTDKRLTFGFTGEGKMTWVALGTLRENGWTCGRRLD